MRGWICCLCAVVALPSAPAVGEPLSVGKWLVDLGRDYALSPQAGVSDADGEIALLFMEAAGRLEPALAEAFLWQSDLLRALEREDEARRILGEYVRLEPGDVAARLNWVALNVESRQTAKARAEACRGYLAGGDLPKEVSSDLHRRLAEFHFNRGELAEAKAAAESALGDYVCNLAARRLLDELRDLAGDGAPSPAVRRIELLLATLAVSPGDAESAWALGNELGALGVGESAERWYGHAASLYELVLPDGPPPGLVMDREMESPMTQPAPGEVAGMVAAFPTVVLDYPLHPEKYLSLSMVVGRSGELGPGEPWRCRVTLTNTGSFPITLGEGMMVVPDVVCAMVARGDQTRRSGPTIHIWLNRRPRLLPGESIEVTQTLDVGAMRSGMIGTPQKSHEVEVSAALSPVIGVGADGEDVWGPAVGGLAAEPVRFRRTALRATAEAVIKLGLQSRAGEIEERITAVDLLAMLLAEHQHLGAGRLKYRARAIKAAEVQAEVLARAEDQSWQVRARLAECMRWFVLDPDGRAAGAKLLRDGHWLVRGLTLRMLADQYRERVGNVLERHAKDDPDEWVRRMAGALLARMRTSTQPAG